MAEEETEVETTQPEVDPYEDLRRQFAESEKQRQEERRARLAAEQEVQRFSQERLDGQEAVLTSAMTARQSELESAKRDLALALEKQDWSACASAQEKLSRAAAQLERLGEGQYALKEQRKAAPKLPTPAEPGGERQANVTAKTQQWLDAHPEVLNNPKVQAKAVASHYAAIAEGYTADSDEYFEFVDRNMGYGQASQKTSSSSGQRRPVASAPSRNAGGASDGRKEPLPRLTAEQKEAAEACGVSEEAYAKNLQAIKDRRTNHSFAADRGWGR